MPCSSPLKSTKRMVRRGNRPVALMARAASITIAALQPLSSAPVPSSHESRWAPRMTDFVGLFAAANFADHVFWSTGPPILLGMSSARELCPDRRRWFAPGAWRLRARPSPGELGPAVRRRCWCGDTSAGARARPSRESPARRLYGAVDYGRWLRVFVEEIGPGGPNSVVTSRIAPFTARPHAQSRRALP